MGVTHRDSEEVIQELADGLAVKLFEREFDDLTEEQKYKCWEQAGEDFHSSRIDAVMDRVELRPCPDSLPGNEIKFKEGVKTMSFYNQYRPHTFGEVVGQEQAITVLQKQAQMHSFHHAYLLFGPSGTGKTTTARILAAALNCEMMNGSGEPCGKCPSCQAVMGSRHWDVMEIDGARFRGIDDIKDLCYKAYFSPMCKRKVYIIDECHQLTDPAWAALLKLIEEPPPHLVIILCTTDYSKIPDTIVSRCQQFPFLKIAPELIKGRLIQVCQTIGIPPETEAAHLDTISRGSNGNMRTSLNALEQIYVCSKSPIPLC